jgi:hypothetical protein
MPKIDLINMSSRHYQLSRFSERKGYRPVKSLAQRESMDDDLRNDLWNTLYVWYFSSDKGIDYRKLPDLSYLVHIMWRDYFKRPLDSLGGWPDIFDEIKKYFFECEWFEVYYFILSPT